MFLDKILDFISYVVTGIGISDIGVKRYCVKLFPYFSNCYSKESITSKVK
jgi:hypothetical protein